MTDARNISLYIADDEAGPGEKLSNCCVEELGQGEANAFSRDQLLKKFRDKYSLILTRGLFDFDNQMLF